MDRQKLFRAGVYSGIASILLTQAGFIGETSLQLLGVAFFVIASITYISNMYHRFADVYIEDSELTEWE